MAEEKKGFSKCPYLAILDIENSTQREVGIMSGNT